MERGAHDCGVFERGGVGGPAYLPPGGGYGTRYAQASPPGACGAAGIAPCSTSSAAPGARAPSPACLGKAPTAADPRQASFVRLNSFLLRTHITSLVSALAEDGWLESWEKERLCRQARDDSGTWTLVFLRAYTRFMEKDDVQGFVVSLRNQIPAS